MGKIRKVLVCAILIFIILFNNNCSSTKSSNDINFVSKTIKLINYGYNQDNGYFDFYTKNSASDIQDTWFALQIISDLKINSNFINKNELIKFINKNINNSNIIQISYIIDILNYMNDIKDRDNIINRLMLSNYINDNANNNYSRIVKNVFILKSLLYKKNDYINDISKIQKYLKSSITDIIVQSNFDELYLTLNVLNESGVDLKNIPEETNIINICNKELKRIKTDKNIDLTKIYYIGNVLNIFGVKNDFDTNRVLRLQNGDGGFKMTDNEPSTLFATYYAIKIL
ncbi:MAG: hypothetical protein QJR05_14575, partial [Thermoanaerobacterium sp.]|nr:hypothetical protein [Thermoanaerobacterium sp.]